MVMIPGKYRASHEELVDICREYLAHNEGPLPLTLAVALETAGLDPESIENEYDV